MKLIDINTLEEKEITYVMRRYEMYYKCRNCKEVFLKWATDRKVYNYETEQAAAEKIIGLHGNRLVEHNCRHGIFGVAELVRIEVE